MIGTIIHSFVVHQVTYKIEKSPPFLGMDARNEVIIVQFGFM